jgi:hypothetical protein
MFATYRIKEVLGSRQGLAIDVTDSGFYLKIRWDDGIETWTFWEDVEMAED